MKDILWLLVGAVMILIVVIFGLLFAEFALGVFI